MYQPQLKQINSVLCLGAHADDIEIGCGAAILAVLDQQPATDVHWVVFSGEPRRANEARLSAQQFLARGTGRHSIRVENFRDSFFPAEWEGIKEYFHELSREVQPDLIFTHRREDMHQDHRVIAELSWCAFRNHLMLEYEIPKYEGDLGQPNVFLPVSRSNASSKCRLLIDSFASQLQRPWFSEETFRAMLRLRGLEANSPSGYAEAFYCRKLCLTTGSSELQTGTQTDRAQDSEWIAAAADSGNDFPTTGS